MNRPTITEIKNAVSEYEAARNEYFANARNEAKRAAFTAQLSNISELVERNGGPLYATYNE